MLTHEAVKSLIISLASLSPKRGRGMRATGKPVAKIILSRRPSLFLLGPPGGLIPLSSSLELEIKLSRAPDYFKRRSVPIHRREMNFPRWINGVINNPGACLLYTSDAADE